MNGLLEGFIDPEEKGQIQRDYKLIVSVMRDPYRKFALLQFVK